jgi:hypothetical protein
MQLKISLRYLEDGWDDKIARGLDQPYLLRYRSNLLGSDLRIYQLWRLAPNKVREVRRPTGKALE